MGGEGVDYYTIGQRIRRFRKAYGLSQEQLAEQAGISVTHMSHIETGNTKLSLPVLVRLAEALQVRTDDLLYDTRASGKQSTVDEMAALLESCTPQQALILLDVLRGAKTALEKQM